MKVSGCIVLYNSNLEDVLKAVNSFLGCGGNYIVVVDNNSANHTLSKLQEEYINESRVLFLKLNENRGYGFGHNRGFDFLKQNHTLGIYHIIINPDIEIAPNCIQALSDYMDDHQDVAISVPKVLNTDGSIQYLNKENPTILDMLIRRFVPRLLQEIWPIKNRCNKYIRLKTGYSEICDVPFCSGCFMFFRSIIYEKLAGFDEDFFLYMEDADISRRAWKFGKVKFIPYAQVCHKWARASHKNLKITIIFVKSVFQYFKKHGIDLL